MSQVIMVRNRCDISPAVADEIRKGTYSHPFSRPFTNSCLAHEESLALLALNEISRPTECIVVARTPTSTDYLVGCALFVLSVSTAKAITMVIVVCGVVLVLYINQQGTTDVKAVDISPERFQQWLNDFSSVDAIVDLSLPVQSVKTIEITNAKNRVLLAEAERLAVAHCEANTCKAIYDPGEQVSIEQLQALKEDPLGSRAQDRAVFEETKRLAALFQFGHSWDAIFCHHLDIAEHASRKEQQACQEQLSNSAKLVRQERREDCASWLEDTADLGIEALYTKADLEAKEQDDLERDRTLKGASLHVRFKVKEIEVVRDELEEKESALEAVQEELAKKKDEIKSLKTRLSDSSRAARKQKSEDRSAISGLQVQLQTKKAELRSLDGEIETLNRNMSVIKSNDSQLMDDIDHLEMEVARLTANAQDHVQLINDLQERINEQTQELEKKSAPSQPAVFNFGGSTTHKSSTAQTGAFQFRGGSNTQSAFSFGGFDSKINDAAKDEEIADFKRQLQELSDQNADLKSRNMELGMACVQFTEERGCLLAEKSEYTKQNDLLRQANAALENLVLQNCQSCENCQLMAEECSLKIQEHQNAFQQQVLRYQEQLVTSLNVSAAQSKLIQKLKLENNDCKAIIRREAAVKDIWSKRSLAVQQVDNADEDIINLPVIDQEPVATAILKPALVNLRIAPNAPALQPGYNAMARFNQHINDNNVWLETMERGVWVHQDKPLFALKMSASSVMTQQRSISAGSS
jgi:predicted  nucleic acid-binding Zn-ribbon protein